MNPTPLTLGQAGFELPAFLTRAPSTVPTSASAAPADTGSQEPTPEPKQGRSWRRVAAYVLTLFVLVGGGLVVYDWQQGWKNAAWLFAGDSSPRRSITTSLPQSPVGGDAATNAAAALVLAATHDVALNKLRDELNAERRLRAALERKIETLEGKVDALEAKQGVPPPVVAAPASVRAPTLDEALAAAAKLLNKN